MVIYIYTRFSLYIFSFLYIYIVFIIYIYIIFFIYINIRFSLYIYVVFFIYIMWHLRASVPFWTLVKIKIGNNLFDQNLDHAPLHFVSSDGTTHWTGLRGDQATDGSFYHFPVCCCWFFWFLFFLILHFNWHFDLSSSLLSQIIFFSSLFDCILLADIATPDRETTISLEFTFTVQSGYPYLSHRSSYIKTNQNRSYLLL